MPNNSLGRTRGHSWVECPGRCLFLCAHTHWNCSRDMASRQVKPALTSPGTSWGQNGTGAPWTFMHRGVGSFVSANCWSVPTSVFKLFYTVHTKPSKTQCGDNLLLSLFSTHVSRWTCRALVALASAFFTTPSFYPSLQVSTIEDFSKNIRVEKRSFSIVFLFYGGCKVKRQKDVCVFKRKRNISIEHILTCQLELPGGNKVILIKFSFN